MYVHIDYGCGFLPERREVVERAVHVVEARRRLARERVERPVHRRERGRGDFGGLRVEFNLGDAPRQIILRVGDGRLRRGGPKLSWFRRLIFLVLAFRTGEIVGL